MSSVDLKSQALATLWEFFEAHGHDPSLALREALGDVIDCLVRMAEERCTPVYYLSSLDPGVGKTQAVVHFLRALVASPEHQLVGVLIGVARLDEVRAYVEAAGLADAQFAVLTSDEDLNALGAGRPTAARVLFTTQQMIEKRTKGARLSETRDFHFRNRPRIVRVWDEELLPAQPITLPLDDLALLVRRYRPLNHALAEQLETFRDELRARATSKSFSTASVDIPDFASKHRLNLGSGLSLLSTASDQELQAATRLWRLSGQTVTLRRDGRYGLVLVHYREHLPADLPPLLVLDASGRVRETYRLWEQHRGGLVRLKGAAKNYGNLTVHVWERGGGKAAFTENSAELIQGIANTIDGRPDEEWLIIHHKLEGEDIPRAIREMVVKADPGKLHFIHWGNHQATNAFVHVSNVVLAGTLFYRPSLYEALGRAAAAYPATIGALDEDHRKRVERGENRHLILQALCRGSVRRSQGETCAPCRAYVIAAAATGIPEDIAEVFPGCTRARWRPIQRQLSGQVKVAADFIVQWFASRKPYERLLFTTVREHLGGMSAGNFFKNIRSHEAFRDFCSENGIIEYGEGRYRRCFTMSPFLPVTEEELKELDEADCGLEEGSVSQLLS